MQWLAVRLFICFLSVYDYLLPMYSLVKKKKSFRKFICCVSEFLCDFSLPKGQPLLRVSEAATAFWDNIYHFLYIRSDFLLTNLT